MKGGLMFAMGKSGWKAVHRPGHQLERGLFFAASKLCQGY
jgi:hypothetical protein